MGAFCKPDVCVLAGMDILKLAVLWFLVKLWEG